VCHFFPSHRQENAVALFFFFAPLPRRSFPPPLDAFFFTLYSSDTDVGFFSFSFIFSFISGLQLLASTFSPLPKRTCVRTLSSQSNNFLRLWSLVTSRLLWRGPLEYRFFFTAKLVAVELPCARPFFPFLEESLPPYGRRRLFLLTSPSRFFWLV